MLQLIVPDSTYLYALTCYFMRMWMYTGEYKCILESMPLHYILSRFILANYELYFTFRSDIRLLPCTCIDHLWPSSGRCLPQRIDGDTQGLKNFLWNPLTTMRNLSFLILEAWYLMNANCNFPVRENLWMVLKGMIKGFGMLPCGVVRMNFGQPVLLTVKSPFPFRIVMDINPE